MVKFDVVVGNPPYQEDIKGTSARQIYPQFMDSAYEIADKAILITPGRFLFNAGKTPKAWNRKMLEDKHLKVVHVEMDSSKVFDNTDITGGIAITYRDTLREIGPIDVFTPYKELESIVHKVSIHESSLTGEFGDIIHIQNKFNLDNVYNDYPVLKERVGSIGKERRLITSVFDKFPELFSDKEDDFYNVGVYGRQNNQRLKKFINNKYLEDSINLKKWKVFVPSANGSGALGEVLSTPVIGQPVIGQPAIGHTQTFISIGSFDTEFEATSCLKYIKGRFSRVMLGVLKVTQGNRAKETWEYVPLQDFTKDSDIDWTKSIEEIDQQLYEKYGLSEEEITFIETHVKEME